MADRYWVGGTGTWGTTTTNWSVSSGGSGGATVPTAADNVFFDAGSNVGTGAFTVTTGSSARPCLNLTISGLDGAMTLAGTLGVTISGSLSLPSTNFTSTITGAMTFASTSTGRTITTNGNILSCPITFNGVGGGWTLQDAFTTTGLLTLTTGALNLGAYTLTASTFSSSNSNTRSIAFGTVGQITLTGSGNAWVTTTSTNFSYTGTSKINISNSGSTATTVAPGAMTTAQVLNFNITTGTYVLTLTTGGAYNDLNFTGFAGSVPLGNNLITVYGNITYSASMTSSGTGSITLAGTTTKTITTNGATVGHNLIINGALGTYTLQDAFTSTATLTLTNGTFDINSKTTNVSIFTILTGTHAITNGTLNCASVTHTSGDLSIGTGYNVICTGTYTFTAGSITINNGVQLVVSIFSSSNTNARSIAFGTGGITTSGSGTPWTTSTPTNFSYTGTSQVNITSSDAVSISISPGAMTAAQALNFNVIVNNVSAVIAFGAGAFNDLNFTGTTCSFSVYTSVITVYGNLTYGANTSSDTTSGSITLAGTSAKTITSNGCTGIKHNLIVNSAGGTYTLQDPLIIGGTGTVTLTSGTLALSSYSLTTVFFSSSGTGTRTLDMGTNTGIFVTRAVALAASETLWNTATTTNLTTLPVGVSPQVYLNADSSLGTRIINSGAASTGNSPISFSITGSADVITFTSGNAVQNLTFTSGFSGIYASVAISMFGNLTLSSTMSSASGAGVLTFSNTSGTSVITSNGITLDFPITINGAGGTVQAADVFTHGSSRAFTLTNGTFDINFKNNILGIFTILTGTHAIRNGTLNCTSVTHTSGELSIGTLGFGLEYNIRCIGTYTFTAGNIQINNNVTLEVSAFSSANTNTRLIEFGAAGKIRTFGTGAVWNVTGVTGLTFTGTSQINITNKTATAVTITNTAISTNALNFDIIDGTYALTITTASAFNDLDFTGFSGSVPLGTAAITVHGNLTYSANTVATATTGSITLAGTTAKTIRTNGITIGHNLVVNGVAGTYTLQDAFTSTGTVTLTNGTFALSTYSFSAAGFISNSATARTLDLGTTTTIPLSGSGITVWNTSTTTNLTVTPVVPIVKLTYTGGTGTRTINTGSTLTGNSAFSFWISGGTDTVTFTASASNTVNNLDFTGFSGTWGGVAISIYGDLTLSSNMVAGSSGNLVTFAKVGGTSIITSNGRAINFPITFNGVGSTFILADNFSHGQTDVVSFTLTNGTLDFNGKVVALRTMTTATGTKSIIFNGSTITFIATVTAFNNASPTGFTTSAGTGVGIMSFTGGGNIEAGGSTFAAKINLASTGININGGGTFDDITNSISPVTVLFQAYNTFNFNNFSLSGISAVNMVTIGSSSTTLQYTLSKTSGTVIVSFCDIRRSIATGGATWRAPTNLGNINTAQNSGWDFGAIVIAAVRNFFAFF